MISGFPSEEYAIPFHYCINQRGLPNPNPEHYRRYDPRGGYKCFFISVNAPSPTEEDKHWMVQFATISYHGTLLNRLLTVRSEWSRK